MDASKLKDWAEAQGHTVPIDPYVQEMLLVHERYYGRTHERNVDRQRAKAQLHQLIDRYQQPFPQPRSLEYPAVKELRNYVQHYQKMKEIENQKALAEQHKLLKDELKEGMSHFDDADILPVSEDDLLLEQKRSRSQSRSR